MQKAGVDLKKAAQHNADAWKKQLNFWYGGNPEVVNRDRMIKDLTGMGWPEDIVNSLRF